MWKNTRSITHFLLRLTLCLSVFQAASLSLSFLIHAQDSPVSRFVSLLRGEAIRDSQTGIVWEQSPDFFYGTWTEAAAHCHSKNTGEQGKWRLPTIKELSTLIDSTQKDPALPAGHPFANIKSSIFWSSTPSETDDIVAWHVSFFSGEVVTDQKSQTRRAWCVLNG